MFAQQTLLASNPSESIEFPIPISSAFSLRQPIPAGAVGNPVPAAEIPADLSIYEAAFASGSGAGCTEVIPAAAPLSDYAFDRGQFTSAALKAAFAHDNLVSMAHYFVPGQPYRRVLHPV